MAVLKLGLTGYPLGHSLSPLLHRAALQALGLDGEYSLYPVPPLPEGAPALEKLLDRVRRGELHGLNVTIPHKRAVFPLLDGLTPLARAVGAANTIFCRDGELIGDNTDCAGFLGDLRRVTAGAAGWVGGLPSAEAAPAALILGAGGAARAVAYALVREGWQVCIAARRPEQARELAEGLRRAVTSDPLSVTGDRLSEGMDLVERSAVVATIPLDQSSISNLQSKITLLVNATPLGMAPEPHSSPWPSGSPFPPGAVVYDLVYNPPETALVRSARAAGLSAFNGLGMLVEQAALAFERWTGRPAPREAMRRAVSSDASQEEI